MNCGTLSSRSPQRLRRKPIQRPVADAMTGRSCPRAVTRSTAGNPAVFNDERLVEVVHGWAHVAGNEVKNLPNGRKRSPAVDGQMLLARLVRPEVRPA